MDQLKELLMEFTTEFVVKNPSVFIGASLSDICKETKELTSYTSSSRSYNTRNTVDKEKLRHYIHIGLKEFKDQQKISNIFDIIKSEKNLSEDTTLAESYLKYPSITINIISGFVVRVLEIQNYKLELRKESFEKAYSELEKFLNNDELEYCICIPLHGVEGTINKIEHMDLIIIKADLELVNQFNEFYVNDMLDQELMIGSYCVKLKRRCLKKDWMREFNNNSKDMIKKVETLLCLVGNGNIRMGRGIRIIKDWTVGYSHRKSAINDVNDFNQPNRFKYNLDRCSEKIQSNYNMIVEDRFNLDLSLEYALKRLKNAKNTTDINDRIVELSLALEYSIVAPQKGVSRVLRNKSAVLFSYNNLDRYLEGLNTIRKFYAKRCKIVHGSEEIELTNENVEIVKNAENIIRENLLLLCRLNQNYTIKEIDNKIKDVIKTISPSTPNVTLLSMCSTGD